MKEFTKESLIRFYKIFPNKVKTLKGYVVAAIDGVIVKFQIPKKQEKDFNL